MAKRFNQLKYCTTFIRFIGRYLYLCRRRKGPRVSRAPTRGVEPSAEGASQVLLGIIATHTHHTQRGLSRYEYSSSNTFITWVFELDYFYNSSIQLSIHEYNSIQRNPWVDVLGLGAIGTRRLVVHGESVHHLTALSCAPSDAIETPGSTEKEIGRRFTQKHSKSGHPHGIARTRSFFEDSKCGKMLPSAEKFYCQGEPASASLLGCGYKMCGNLQGGRLPRRGGETSCGSRLDY
jgi:hypothetical protein